MNIGLWQTAAQYKNELAAAFGAMLQFIIVKKAGKGKITLLVTLAIITIFVTLYILEPLIEYFDIHKPMDRVIYAFGGLFSMEIMSILTTFLPRAVRAKILLKLGVDYDDIKPKND